MVLAQTLTPELNPVFSILILGLILVLLIVQVVGVIRKEAGDTITEHWRFANEWLKSKGMAGQWAAWGFRIFTAGLLIWALLHFIAGSE